MYAFVVSYSFSNLLLVFLAAVIVGIVLEGGLHFVTRRRGAIVAGLTTYEFFFGAMLVGVVGVLTYFELAERLQGPRESLAGAVERLGGKIQFAPDEGEPQTVEIDFSDRPIGDEDLKCLNCVACIKRLDLSNTRVTDAGVRRLLALQSLQELDLSETAVTDAIVADLTVLPDLQLLSVAGTRISDSGLQQLAACPTLRTLRGAGQAPSVEKVTAEQADRAPLPTMP